MEKIIYIAACDKEGGVYTCRICADGSAEIIEKTACDRPMFLAKENGFLYVLLRGDAESRLVRYTIGADGRLSGLTDLGGTGGKCACHLTVKNGTVYTVNYLSGSVRKIPGKTVQQTGGGVHPARQEVPHTHFVCFTPDNQYVLVVNLGNDTIYTYDLELNEVSRAKVPDGEGCRHLIFSPDGTICYCANELGNTVTVFGYNNGVLTRKETYSTLPEDFEGENTVAAIRLQNGYLYVSNRGHNSVAVFKVQGETLERKTITDIGGNFPRDFDIFGDIMVVTNQLSDSVTLFKVDGASLTKLPSELSMPVPLCVIE